MALCCLYGTVGVRIGLGEVFMGRFIQLRNKKNNFFFAPYKKYSV